MKRQSKAMMPTIKYFIKAPTLPGPVGDKYNPEHRTSIGDIRKSKQTKLYEGKA